MLIDNNDQFEYIQFSSQRSCRTSKGHFSIHYNKKAKNPSYYLSFNKDLSDQIKGRYKYFKLRRDRITDDIFFIFTNVKDKFALNIRSNAGTINVHSKSLMDFLIDKFKIQMNDLMDSNKEIRITNNLSKTDECVVVKIIK